MKGVFKQLFSFILPFTVLVLIPFWIETKWEVKSVVYAVVGISVMLAGLVIMTITIGTFIQKGKGTLAPWSPTQKLIVTGLYRYMRNPMITGVFFVLIGEAICFHSMNILIWSGCFILINTIYFIVVEEPGLEKRFGKEYTDYKSKVPRWIPRLTPFNTYRKTQ
jgi:protein-S-isoprenylcysteine O-methyltransferase Ste14